MKRLELEQGTPRYRVLQGGLLAAALLVAVMIPQSMPPFRVYQFTLVLIAAVAVLGLNLLTGFAGQISLGHSAFFALGAYTSAYLIVDMGWNYALTLPVAFVVCFLAGIVFGIPALRLEGLYLALITLGLAVVTPPLIKRFDGFTGGSGGRAVPEPAAPAWSGLADDQWQYYVVLAVTVVMFVIARNLVSGRVGRALRAVRDNELAAESMGVHLAVFKTLAFAYSAAYAGAAGGMFAFIVAFVSPESFGVNRGIGFLAAMVVGGLASIPGAIFGALFIEFVPEFAHEIDDALAGVVYGAALIIVMFVMPGGAVGLIRRVFAKVVTIRPPGGGRPVVSETDVSPAFSGAGALLSDDDTVDRVGTGGQVDAGAPAHSSTAPPTGTKS